MEMGPKEKKCKLCKSNSQQEKKHGKLHMRKYHTLNIKTSQCIAKKIKKWFALLKLKLAFLEQKYLQYFLVECCKSICA